MEHTLSPIEEADARKRIQIVEKCMADNQIEIVAYPRWFHMANGVYGTEALVQLMDVKYQKKPRKDIPSPFIT